MVSPPFYFNMGFPIVVRWHLYIEMLHCFLVIECSENWRVVLMPTFSSQVALEVVSYHNDNLWCCQRWKVSIIILLWVQRIVNNLSACGVCMDEVRDHWWHRKFQVAIMIASGANDKKVGTMIIIWFPWSRVNSLHFYGLCLDNKLNNQAFSPHTFQGYFNGSGAITKLTISLLQQLWRSQ